MTHGGKRVGAGRPAKEPTTTMRVPVSKIEAVKALVSNETSLKVPFYGSKVRAGFPSPADDYIEDYLDLNEY